MIADLATRRGVPAKEAEPDNGCTRQASSQLKTLVLDDEWLNADLIAMMAEDCGSKIIGVANTVIAAAIFADAQSPQLALIDVQLGQGADGITYAESLRKRHGTLIAIMTGAGDIATLRRIERFRPFATILKPFTVQQLQDVVDRASDLV